MERKLQRKMTLTGLTLIAVGSSIGSGIFISPSEVVMNVPSPFWALIVWCIGGLIALTGSLSLSELGAKYPAAGGVYVYLREAFGLRIAFLYGWATLLVINTGALAALSLAFVNFLGFWFPVSETEKLIIASILIIGLTAMNTFGVQVSQAFAGVFTGMKLFALAFIIICGVLVFGDFERVLHPVTSFNPTAHPQMFLTGLIGVLWSFGGWHHASYLSGEAINPQKSIPKAMIIGTVIVTGVYLLANLAYFMLLDIPQIMASDKLAGDALQSVISSGGKMVSIAIMISVFGTIGIYTMSAPRIYYAMAEDGVFYEKLSKIHPKYGTPYIAMWSQAIWAVLLIVLWRTFSNLITYTTFIDIIFMCLAGVSVLILRKKNGVPKETFKVPFYPIIPLIFICITGAFVINTVFAKFSQSIAGLAVVAAGLISYSYFKQRKSQLGN